MKNPVPIPVQFEGELDMDIYARKQNIEELQGGGMGFFDINTGNQQAAQMMQNEPIEVQSGNNNATNMEAFD